MRWTRAQLTDAALGALVLAFSAWVWWAAESTISRGMRTDPLGPAAVPQLLAIGTGVLGILLAISRLVPNRWLKPSSVGEDLTFSEESGGTFSWARLLGLTGLSVAYLALMEPLGYLLITPVYAAAILLLLGVRAWRRVLLAVVVMVAALFLLFQLGLGIPLPRGPLAGY